MKNATQLDYEQRILRVLVHIQTHLDHALDLDELASLAHFSPYHFHRVFRGMVGEPVMEHVRRLRLERAAFQLKTGNRPVTQIAFDAGYETHEAFSRAFRAMFHEAPTQFRKTHRRIPAPSAPSGVHYTPEAAVEGFTPLQAVPETAAARIETFRPMHVAFLRHVGPYDEVGPLWQRLMEWAFSRGLAMEMTRPLALCHDDPDVTPPDKLRYDACIGVGEQFESDGEVGVQDIPGGDYAIMVHRGPYSRLGETYALLVGRWLPARNREAAVAPCLEFYLNNPNQTPAEDWLTEVCVPLQPSRYS